MAKNSMKTLILPAAIGSTTAATVSAILKVSELFILYYYCLAIKIAANAGNRAVNENVLIEETRNDKNYITYTPNDSDMADDSLSISGTPAMTYTVYGVSAEITSTEPGMLFLDGEGHTTVDTKIKYSIKPPDNAEADKLRVILATTAGPNERKRLQSRIDAITAEYNALIADIDIFERVPGANPDNDLWITWLPGSATSGEGTATIFRGATFDSTKEYNAQVVLNKGSDVEVRGEKLPIPLASNLVIFDKKNPCNRMPNSLKPVKNNTFLLSADQDNMAYPIIHIDIEPTGRRGRNREYEETCRSRRVLRY